MKYKGIEIREFTSDKCEVFDPPKTMLVWHDVDDEPSKDNVFAFIPNRTFHVIGTDDSFDHCAEIPEILCRRVTNSELAKWLAQGNGQYQMGEGYRIWTEHSYDIGHDEEACPSSVKVCKWGDKEWHKPTREYLGLDD